MNQHLQNILDVIQNDDRISDDQKNALLKSVKEAEKEFEITSFKLDRTEKVKRTTAILLEETIDELEKKRKDIEKHNRELEIEAALEKVRSGSLAMHHTSELQDVINTVHQQLKSLKIEITGGAFIVINEENQDELNCWGAGGTADYVKRVHIPYYDRPIYTGLINGIKKGEGSFNEEFSYEEKMDFFKNLFKYPPYTDAPPERKVQIMSRQGGYTRSCVVSKYTSIFIINHHGRKFTEEENNILKRFGKVFEQAYTRFLDLQKAEAQAREAEIEAALERVRARSLAMKSSDELLETSDVMFSELERLSIDALRIGICTINGETGSAEIWSRSEIKEQKKNKILGIVPKGTHPVFDNMVKAWKRKKQFFSSTRKGKDVSEYYNKLASHLSYPLPKKYNEQETITCYFFDEGSLNVVSLQPLIESDGQIMLRFANVFGQIYTRFLDLQKAEALAREAEIQLALERVRARTMAMQHSDELSDAAFLLANQVRDLGIKAWGCAFHIYADNENGDYEWFSNEKGYLPFYKTPREKFFKEYYDRRESGEKLFVKEFKGDECAEHYDYLLSLPALGDALRDLIKSGIALPESQIDHVAYFDSGHLLFITYEHDPSAHDIFIRFAKEFKQTYTRFLDLQKAEKQAREAEIEMSLERVRAKAMAMRNSSDIPGAVSIVFKELSRLGIEMERNGIVLISEDTPIMEVWSTRLSPQDQKEVEIISGLLDSRIHPLLQGVYKAWKAEEKHYFYELVSDEVRKYYELLKKQKDYRFPTVEEYPDFQIGNGFLFKEGQIFVFTKKHLTEEEKEIFYRFTHVFSHTYRRYIDIVKAEKQAREAEIEMSLERVRAKAMAMRSSKDIPGAVAIVFKELRRLGIEMERNGIVLISADTPIMEIWSTRLSPKDQKEVEIISGLLDSRVHPMPQGVYNTWKAGNKYFSYELRGEEVRKYYELLEKQEAYRFPTNEKYSDFQVNYGFPFKEGQLFAVTNHHLLEEEKEIFQRFTKVFAHTYRRYTDIVNAEKRAREAEIEMSLERIRAKAMAMRSSSDIPEAVAIVFNELGRLGIFMERCGIVIFNNPPVGDLWSTPLSPENKQVIEVLGGKLNFEIHPMLAGALKSWKNKNEYYSYALKGQEVPQYYELLEKAPDYRFPLVEYYSYNQILNTFNFSEGLLFAYSVEPLSIEDQNIFLRFTKVFSLTFRRYQDLIKAEKQAREAEIEMSLERIRAKAMAMRSSQDISEATAIVFNELGRLGIKMERSGIATHQEGTIFNIWSTPLSPENRKVIKVVNGQLDFSFHPMIVGSMESWKKQDPYYYYDMVGNDEIRSYYQLLEQQTKYRFPLVKNYPERQILNSFNFSEGMLFAYTVVPVSEEEQNIFLRFTKVFSLTFRRYLDLIKAETQAREAQIEAALERVRARTMAMHQSTELTDAGNMVFQQMKVLGIQAESSWLWFIDQVKEEIEIWTTHKNQLAKPVKVNSNDYWTFKEEIDAWKNNKEFYKLKLTSGEFIKVLKEVFGIKISLSKPAEFVHLLQIRHKYGFLGLGTLHEATEREMTVYARFAKVFEQTYTRFLDLQKAETQAREAIKQASLDRIRGQIASMRTSDDLNRITPVIWRELQALEVPFIRCGVFIVNETTQKVEVYLSTPEGKALAALNLSFDANELTKNTLEHWRKKRIFHTHWNKNEFIEWTRSMMAIGQVENAESYQGATAAPNSLDLHFVPFKQGMLYVGDSEQLSPEKTELVKTLAEAFSIAYARYEDFKNLEEAKNKIEITLSELKAAQSQLVQSEKMASLGELTAGIAHEIQNPLNFVNNFSEVSTELLDELREELAKGDLEEVQVLIQDVVQNLEKINHHGKRAESIVKGMLLHSRGSSGKKEATDINALADEYLRLSYHGFRAKDKSFNADFKLEADEKLSSINVVPQDFGRVLLNLLNNAFYAVDLRAKEKTAGYKPMVSVSTQQENGSAVIRIKDNGNGIPDSVKEKIFQPFFTTKPTGKGTGLGLSLSYDIVKAHGGELKVVSGVGKGTEFTIEIPNT